MNATPAAALRLASRFLSGLFKKRARDLEQGEGRPLFDLEPMEPRLLLSATAGPFTDSDGDTYTVKVTGPGTATVVQTLDANQHGPIGSIALTWTTAASILSV